MIADEEYAHLRRCIELAGEALAGGHAPFGSVLVGADGTVLAEDHNRAGSGDPTRHPEFELARWAANHLSEEQRAGATVFTSGEHCPMCAAAHAIAGLGRIVYIVSSRQFEDELAALGHPAGRVRNLPVGEIAPDVLVEGPVPELAPQVLALYRRRYGAG